MSAVTKTFVLLNVVFSLLLTAAVVVFVSKTDNYNKQVEDADARTALANSAKELAEKQANSLSAQLTQARTDAATRASQFEGQIASHLQNLAKLETQKIGLDHQIASRDAQIQTLAQTLQGSQAAESDAAKQIAALRGERDDLMAKKQDVDLEATRLQKTNQQLTREVRFLNEQIADMKAQHEKVLARAQTGGLASVAIPTGLTEISGVIREVQPFEGKVFATISVGRADKVQEGMTFVVISGDKYMGKFTVRNVEPNQAFGALEGPHISEIRPDMQVRSQM